MIMVLLQTEGTIRTTGKLMDYIPVLFEGRISPLNSCGIPNLGATVMTVAHDVTCMVVADL